MRIFFRDSNVYTDSVSDDEYANRILYGQPCESLVKYYDEITEEILTEYFPVKKCPNKHIWYGEWENHRRIVIKLHQFYSHKIRFGYNYDYIPILNRQDKFVYNRTDKAVDLDVMDNYFNHIDYEPANLTHMESFNIRRKYQLPEFGSSEDLDFAKEYIRDSVRTNIPFMQDFFTRYKSDIDVISFLDHMIEYGNRFEKYRYIWTKAFLYAKLHNMDKALEAMKCYYGERDIPQQVINKLEGVNGME